MAFLNLGGSDLLASLIPTWIHPWILLLDVDNFKTIVKMKTLALLLIAIFSFARGTGEDEYTGARLLVSKQILNKYLVEDMDILIKVGF